MPRARRWRTDPGPGHRKQGRGRSKAAPFCISAPLRPELHKTHIASVEIRPQPGYGSGIETVQMDPQQGSDVMATSSAKKPDVRKSSATAKAPAKPPAQPAPKVAVTAPKATAPAAPEASGEMVLAPVAPAEKKAKVAAPQLKKKELIARVVTALDGKKKGTVKDIVEATLATLGEALQKGEALNLPPFGRARVSRQKGEGAGSLTTLRLRGAGEKNAPKAGKQALAEDGEDD